MVKSTHHLSMRQTREHKNLIEWRATPTLRHYSFNPDNDVVYMALHSYVLFYLLHLLVKLSGVMTGHCRVLQEKIHPVWNPIERLSSLFEVLVHCIHGDSPGKATLLISLFCTGLGITLPDRLDTRTFSPSSVYKYLTRHGWLWGGTWLAGWLD